MRSIPNMTKLPASRISRLFVIGVITAALSAAFAQSLSAQCIDHPNKKTALKFSNETRFELTFFVDFEEKGVVVAPGLVSDELEVVPGEHILRARAILKGESVWVWVVNEVPVGYVCTWTVDEKATGRWVASEKFRTAIAPGSKRKATKINQRR